MEIVKKQQNKIMRAALYLRVSTEEQAKEGHYGLVVQEEKCRAFCKSQADEGYSLDDKHVYKDEMSGGLPIEKRPALRELFEAARNKEFDMVVVYKTDRLARSVRILANAIHELENMKIAFRSVTEPFDTTTSFGKTAFNLFGTFAEFEREMIRERTMSGKINAAKSGKWVTGIPSYGYCKNKDTKKLEIVSDEAKTVKKMFYWLVDERLPLREITRKLNNMNVPTPYSTKIKKKTHNYWYPRTVGRILTNEVYTGIFYLRKYVRPYKNLESVINKKMLRPEEDWIRMEVPSIVSKKLYEKAVGQLSKNYELARRNQKRDYLFSKLIYCGVCNFKMFSGYQPPRKYKIDSNIGKYYHGAYRKSTEPGNTERCKWCPQYAETRLEPIWEVLKEILQNPKNMLQPLEQYIYKENDPKHIKVRLVEIEKELQTVQTKKDKVQQVFIDSDMEKYKYNEYMTGYKREEEKLNDEVTCLHQNLLNKAEKKEREESIGKVYKQIKSKLDNVCYEDKSKIIRLFVECVTLYAKENYVEVVFKFPSYTHTKQVKLPNNKKTFPLVLNIKTLSERERQAEILRANPLMFKATK